MLSDRRGFVNIAGMKPVKGRTFPSSSPGVRHFSKGLVPFGDGSIRKPRCGGRAPGWAQSVKRSAVDLGSMLGIKDDFKKKKKKSQRNKNHQDVGTRSTFIGCSLGLLSRQQANTCVRRRARVRVHVYTSACSRIHAFSWFVSMYLEALHLYCYEHPGFFAASSVPGTFPRIKTVASLPASPAAASPLATCHFSVASQACGEHAARLCPALSPAFRLPTGTRHATGQWERTVRSPK